jgi:uncharacterized membrane protein
VSTAIQVISFLLIPFFSLWLQRFSWAKKVGSVVITYVIGISLGNLFGSAFDKNTSVTLSGVGVLVAIPLMLFPSDIRTWPTLARPLLISFALACFSAVFSAGAVSIAFRDSTDEWWKVAGMLVGVYVGGSANMSAVGLALGVKENTFLLLNASDIVVGGIYLLLLLSIAQRILLTFLRQFLTPTTKAQSSEMEGLGATKKSLVFSLFLAIGIFLLSAGISFLLHKELVAATLMLVSTTLGLVASLNKKVRHMPGSNEAGEYFLLVFSVAIGSLADIRQMASGSATLFLFVLIVMSASAVLHFGLCKLFGIDADTALISQTATIFGPPFIGPVCKAIKNQTLVGPGLTLGLMGIATKFLRQTYAKNLLRWLAFARSVARIPVYSGILTETAPNVFTYVVGGNTMKINRFNGTKIELRVTDIYGDVTDPTFPIGNDRIDASWIWAPGVESKFNLRPTWSRFDGNFADIDDNEFVAHLLESRNTTANSGNYGSGFFSETSGDMSFTGTIAYPMSQIDVDTSIVFSTCSGSCGSSDYQDFIYTHSPKLTLGAEHYSFSYHTGFTKRYAGSTATYRWDGSFNGTRSGQLVQSSVGSAEGLEVVVGGDRYLTRGVAYPP